MDHPFLHLSATALTTVTVGVALVTDLRQRRIPNRLTFPAMVAGLVLWTACLGWMGLASSVGGLFAAPLLLVVIHLGRGPGMGDIKLAAAVGSLLGPRLAIVAMLLSALAGGLLALCYQVRSGGPLASTMSAFLVGVPGLARWARVQPELGEARQPGTVPYAVGIAVGSLLTLVVYWCTENAFWLL